MSYDIYFVRRDPGQSFADALEATEESYDGDPGPLSDAELEQWERIVERAGQLLTQIQEFGSPSSRELSDAETGIQLSMLPDEVSLTVPDDSGQESVSLMATVYALARVVEDETGLEGYDPQLGEPVTDPQQRLDAVAPSRPPRRHDDDDDDDWGSFAGTRASAVPPPPPARTDAEERQPSSRRRWWEFWKR